MKTLKKYLTIYLHLVLFSLKAKMEYRLNFFIQTIYGPAYILVLYLLMKIAFDNAPSLAGWSFEEGMMLFTAFHLMYSLSTMTFLTSVRDLLWSGLRLGNLDMILTKPVNTQLFSTFYQPEIQQIPMIIGLLIIFFSSLWRLPYTPSIWQIILFISFWLLGILINYLTITTYLTLGFFVVKAQQIIELYDKASDHGQYPTSMFPASIQWVVFSIAPVGFMSFVPVSILLGKANWAMFMAPIIVTTGLFIINQYAWKHALRSYTSASS